ncbi:MAG: hypothetical protein CFH15_01457 [Alphaproteobacteria bacterium MarineAlpha5_Bin5]|nr:MAG: hypothetical protein CFH15_01457 [Alphaproteobacteria bacterium MarineAlpha5_Bin5]PPR52086.1 MAG: hypothetical protein CFH14_00526 [Alphaproteobacteria bacterium MarineAlpha5_Bin4]|tara:strand:+ start:2539 stop:3063 length:525 start_codon:yes stop_codon:yes gene_type:complete
MIKKYIFKKKKNYKLNFIFIFLLFFFGLLFFFTYHNLNHQFIIIEEFTGDFYIIPKNKGGEKVSNIDKKSLNLTDKKIIEVNNFISDELKYSIQFITNTDYNLINKYLISLINKNETIFTRDEFYLLAFTTDIGTEYFLLYKNFQSKEKAYNYCSKYLTILDNCLIVDVEKFNN